MSSGLENIINASVAETQYEPYVRDILRDRDSGWKLDYYKDDGKNSHNVLIIQLQNECSDLELTIAANEKLMKKLDKDIDNARRQPTDPLFKRAKKGDLVLWNKQYAQAREDIYTDGKLIEEIKSVAEVYKWNQLLEEQMRKTIRWLRGHFMMYRDSEFLAKGITWAMNERIKQQRTVEGFSFDTASVPYSDRSAW
jgi:hypothetical protein